MKLSMDCHSNDVKANAGRNQSNEGDLEKQRVAQPSSSLELSTRDGDDNTPLTIVVSTGESKPTSEVPGPGTLCSQEEGSLACAVSPKKEFSSTASSSDEQCRICQQEKEEVLIELGCHCRGGLAKAHRTCIDTWFRTIGSNRCEICQVVAANVSPPQSHHGTNYWIWRIDPTYRTQDPQRQYCFSPLWLAFAILIGGLLLDILISITLGVSALPVNIIIGVIVVLGLGTVFRLALEFFQEWNSARGSQRVESNVTIGYFPAI
ncbi:E3 ubiquitin-protein ligase MARCH2 isoform X1 [Cucumis melo var. makuwa]|uniref:E3 ubiquitin-protein ligase MARCH2 isoform X1 n=1 Tax=Cucumis melo var. makuwa TaxID=1194695 RepID=A0A5A7TM25_CUCMM|nr:E3 ubiquitin-protein ligase MARCH2 isoform X1 [Cucumis melo var. makuwa]TYK06032.1 E3 ubiquitin-protein ligase MARCH2 isoform X1 [Cucumis melo var. makuwa]